jgi:hypothetical protein
MNSMPTKSPPIIEPMPLIIPPLIVPPARVAKRSRSRIAPPIIANSALVLPLTYLLDPKKGFLQGR